MGRRSAVLSFLVFGLALQISGCAETPGPRSAVFSTPDGSPATAFLGLAAQNARAIGAKSRMVGTQASIVTYAGPPRDFIACSGGSQDPSAKAIVLDTRTTLRAEGPRLRADTAYIATAGGNGDAPSSIAFGNTDSARFADGTQCRATGRLERSLLGLQ